jgi:hypothetical protein
LLLVVLGMLSMFAMIGLTFVVLTGQARRIAEVGQAMEQEYVPPQADLDRAMAQVARGSSSPLSAIGPHSLLEDMYGPGSVQSTITNISQLTTVPSASGGTVGAILEIATGIANAERYSGSVLTMLNGPAAGCSARIIGYQVSGGRSARFQLLSTESIDYNTLVNYIRTYGRIDYVVNGMPFSGKGFGLYTSTGTTPGLSDEALRPGSHRFNYWPNGGSGTSAGEANEDYDAADHQNMLLAVVKGPVFPTGTASTNDDTIRVPVPSLHRPDLARYWVNRGQYDASASTRYILRPLQRTPDSVNSTPSIHRAFTGSNRGTFNPLWDGTYANSNGGNFSWDVDNDGDGVPDSVWVDLGLQVRSTADGRLYKPLYAILCTDLDGRLNLNAHGCPAQVNSNYYINATTPNTWIANTNLRNSTQRFFASGLGYPNLLFPNGANYSGVNTLPLWRGLGLGPAEINLRALFDSGAPAAANIPSELLWLFRGRSISLGAFEGRYGETVGNVTSLPGLGSFRVNYWPSVYTLLNNRETTYAKNYYATFDAYGSPPDLDGDCAVALDVAGRPVYWGMGEAEPSGTTAGSNNYMTPNYTRNTPYELNLTRGAGWRRDVDPNQNRSIDNPFTPAELERVLRAFDLDAASLPPRLLALTADANGNVANSLLLRRAAEITTESWDLPCPAVVLPPELRGSSTVSAQHLMYLLYLKTSQAGAARTGSQLVSLARNLLPPEMLAGLRMNLNRPFGNGRDSDGDGVVDEPDEVAAEKLVTFQGVSNIVCDPANGNYNNYNGGNTRVRQFYARNLYCLALLLLDMEHTWDTDRLVTKRVARRRIAQWAVNVVDFYDRDSIMTRFAYDCNPFDSDGWTTVNDDTNPDKGGIVWGVERPELLLTETLAFHDRRTEDTDQEEKGTKTTDTTNPDPNFDQRLRPQGSLFIELFNPWSPDESRSADIHVNKASTAINAAYSHPLLGAVNLAQRTPAVAGVSYPVWQILITSRTQKAEEIDYPQTAAATTGTAEGLKAERAIYFVEDFANLPKDADLYPNVRYYPAKATSNLFRAVAPGEYAVIGPGEEADVSESRNYLGFETGRDQGDKGTRQIVLELDPTSKLPLQIIGNNQPTPSTEKVIRPPVPFIINRSDPINIRSSRHQRLSISEPTGGYTEDASSTFESGRSVYSPVLGTPVDVSRTDDNVMRNAIQNNGSKISLRMIHLRRLADPTRPYSNDEKKPEQQNIYRTIDSIPVDLTAFNGAAPYDPNELGAGNTVRPVAMDSRERGDNYNPADPFDIWRQEEYDTANEPSNSATPAPPADHNYDRAFTHTLGYLNSRFGTLSGATAPTTRAVAHLGDPPRPFPWFAWNNRPFFSPYELMVVPWNNSAQLLDPDHYGQTVAGLNYYAGGTLNTPYRHLPNFFQSQAYSSSTSATKLPQFFRLLDMVRVPSRFVGTQVQLDPSTMANTGNLEHYFRPPFNWVDTYREPGRVNINTIYSYDVFRGLMNYCGSVVNSPGMPQSDMLLLWDKVVRSRRGDGSNAAPSAGGGTTPTNTFLNTVNGRMLQLNQNVPSRFSNPFRSYAGGHLRHASQHQQLTTRQMEAEVNATLLRRDPDVANRPLFEFRSTQPHEEYNRNPFFRYRNFERLGNLVTTRSNVYAIWITVGYFEVRRSTNTLFPDGYELGQELGVDTGDMQRHRAFYIFDRSIPVGFIRGMDLNYEKALLIRRYIE